MKRLSDGEKEALEKGELAEHLHGDERERLQTEVRHVVRDKEKDD